MLGSVRPLQEESQGLQDGGRLRGWSRGPPPHPHLRHPVADRPPGRFAREGARQGRREAVQGGAAPRHHPTAQLELAVIIVCIASDSINQSDVALMCT